MQLILYNQNSCRKPLSTTPALEIELWDTLPNIGSKWARNRAVFVALRFGQKFAIFFLNEKIGQQKVRFFYQTVRFLVSAGTLQLPTVDEIFAVELLEGKSFPKAGRS